MSSSSDQGPAAVFAAWLARREAGEELEFEPFCRAHCRAHPGHAAELRELHAQWSARVRGSSPSSEDDDDEQDSTSAAPGMLLRLAGRGSAAGRYRVKSEIAKGGMAVVLRVWDEDLRRYLAMKVMVGKVMVGKVAGEESASSSEASRVLSRFLEEAEVTGQLDHPGIVPVHELGLDAEGRVFFTMKLVRGKTLEHVFDELARGEGGWTQTRVLGALLKVCEAMSYAHSKGVIHRDLKPANIMVGRYGEVYVMDWGLARVLARGDEKDIRIRPVPSATTANLRSRRHPGPHADSDSPLVTMDGDVVGTPAYMPPEQACGRIEEMRAHSDVYAVGAMLYQLLAGHAPYLPRGVVASNFSVLRWVMEGPPLPLESAAPNAPLELVAISAKAMSRDPRARYADMTELGADLLAFVEGRVVRAYETGTWAETRKWVRRNKPLAASLGAAALATFAGVIAFGVEARRATHQALVAQLARTAAEENEAKAKIHEGEARASAARARRVTELVQDALISSDPNQGGSQEYRVVDAMQAAVQALEGEALAEDPETKAALQETISGILDGNGRSEEGLHLAEQALATRRRLFAGDHEATADSLDAVAACLSSLGRNVEALSSFEAALEMRQRLLRGDHQRVAQSLNNVAFCLQVLGRSAEALPKFEAALEMNRRLSPGDHADVAANLNNVAFCLDALGRSAAALPHFEAALDMRRRLFQGEHPHIADSLNNVAFCLDSLGRSAEALPRYEAALEMRRRLFQGDHPDVADSLNNVAVCLDSLGRSAEALPKYAEVLEMYQRLFPGDHPSVAGALNNTGFSLHTLGRFAEALPVLEAALAMRRHLFAEDHPALAASLNNLASCLNSLGRSSEALPIHLEALAMRQRLFQGDHPDVAMSLGNVADSLDLLGRTAEALPHHEAALEMYERLFQGDHPDVAEGLRNVAESLHASGRSAEALAFAERAQAMGERVFSAGHPRRERIDATLARIRGSLSR